MDALLREVGDGGCPAYQYMLGSSDGVEIYLCSHSKTHRRSKLLGHEKPSSCWLLCIVLTIIARVSWLAAIVIAESLKRFREGSCLLCKAARELVLSSKVILGIKVGRP